MDVPERGDLVFLNFNPQSGHEQAGARPGIVLSPKAFNLAASFAVICPITSKRKGYPFEVPLPTGLAIHGVILTDQVKSLDWSARELKVVGKVPSHIVEDCLDLISTFLS
ncbi:type II toxin-antitoxin system PemK/MazF family toxin [Tepidibacillus marianensis]|uniref:type II toxin-antitoxin system PemK/MazF family toxin n=1 Tax=Tepidibacillus marianensis TaxID=3131995 RepID=UPI0030D25747